MKKKPNLKVKRKLGTSTTSFTGDTALEAGRHTLITNEERRIFYNSLQNIEDPATHFTELPSTKLLATKQPTHVVASSIIKLCPTAGPTSICSCDLPPPNREWLTRQPQHPLEIDSARILQEMRTTRSNMIRESINACILQQQQYLKPQQKSTDKDPSYSPSLTVTPPHCSIDEDVIIILDTPPTPAGEPSPLSAPVPAFHDHGPDDNFDQEMEDDFDILCNEIDANILNEVDRPSKASPLVCSICDTTLMPGSTLKDLEEHMNSCCPIDDLMQF